MKLLQEDPAETTRDILYTISQQLANNSFPPFPRVKYEDPQYAVVVNGLLFTSLSFSLIAALLAVLALQWVANYDMGLNTSSARKRALQRHTRWKGIERWKMGEIIASLPLLIFVSLFLFFVGIADWLWHLNRAISGIVIGGLGIGFIVYAITNFISIVKLDAPFRTPVSKGLALLTRQALSWTKFLILTLLSEVLKRGEVPNRVRWKRIRKIWKKTYYSRPVPPQNFGKCEEIVVERRDETAMESLIWLANSMEISMVSYDQFSILTQELSRLPGRLLLRKDIIDQAPWNSILTMLSSPYLGRKLIEEFTVEEVKVLRDICKSFSMISSGIDCPSLSAVCRFIQGSDPLVDVAFHLMMYRHFKGSRVSLCNAIHLTRVSISSIEESYLQFILLTIQQSWPDLEGYRRFILEELIGICTGSCNNNGGPYSIPIECIRIILDLAGRQYENTSQSINIVHESAIIGRYISTIQRMKGGIDREFGDQIHRAIQQQLLLHISLIDFSLPSATNQLAVLFDLLLALVSSKPLALADEERDNFVHLLTKIHEDSDGTLENVVQEALLTGLHYSYGTDDQPFDRWISLVLAFDEYLERKSMHSKDDSLNAIHFLCRNPPEIATYSLDPVLRDRLIRVKDTSIALWLAEYCPYDWEFEGLINPDTSTWNDAILLSVRFVRERHALIRADLHIRLLRAMIIDGPLGAQRDAISFLEADYQPLTFITEEVIRSMIGL
jgi:hypothetical protein